jgi:hypothetical protein
VLTVRVFDNGAAPAQVLRQASAVAERVFRHAGIETEWLICKATVESTDQDAGCYEPHDERDPNLQVVPAAGEKLLPMTEAEFGFTPVDSDGSPGRYAYVLYARIEREVERGVCSMSALLGLVMAHEVGHLLLGRGHAARGVMTARWDRSTEVMIARGGLVFGRDEVERMKNTISPQRR